MAEIESPTPSQISAVLLEMAELHRKQNKGHNVWTRMREMDVHMQCTTCTTSYDPELLEEAQADECACGDDCPCQEA